MLLSIITLSYNTPDLSVDSVKSLSDLYTTELENDELEITVVDNASEKDTVLAIEKYIKKLNRKNIKLIKNNKNYGFGVGNNIGARGAKGKYLLFLNSDTYALDKGLLDMASFMEVNEKVGVTGARLLNFDGTPQKNSTGKFYTLLNFFIMAIGGERMGFIRNSPIETKPVDWVSGACLMVRKDLFQEVGGFDEKIFMYMEDQELCFSIRKKGYMTYFYSNAAVKHKEQGSSNRTFAVNHIYKGLLYFYSKHMNKWQYIIVKFTLFIKAFVLNILGKVTGNVYLTKTYGQALEIFR